VNAWLIWRLVKMVGVVLYGAGLYGAITGPGSEERLRSASRFGGVGLLLSWVGGYALMKATGVSLHTGWIGFGLISSLVGLHGAFICGLRPERTGLGAALAAGGAMGALAVMVFRALPLAHAYATVLAVGAGVVAFLATRHNTVVTPEPGEVAQAATRWFKVVARAEGTSLLVLFGVFMPLKYGAGILIDGGNGWIGWAHGVFVMLYVQALWMVARQAKWPVSTTALAFAASLFPFGTFAFEAKAMPQD